MGGGLSTTLPIAKGFVSILADGWLVPACPVLTKQAYTISVGCIETFNTGNEEFEKNNT